MQQIPLPPNFEPDLPVGQQFPAESAPAVRTVYSKGDRATAWACVVLGWLFVRNLLDFSSGPVLTLFWLAAVVVMVVRCFVSGAKVSFASVSGALCLCVGAFCFALTANPYVYLLGFGLMLWGCLYWLMVANQTRSQNRLGEMLPFDLLKGTFIMPFGSFGKLFCGLFVPNKKPSKIKIKWPKGRTLWWAVLGVFLAILPTLLIILLLSQSDAAFANLMQWLSDLNLDFGWAMEQLLFVILGLPLAMFAYGAIYSNLHHRFPGALAAQNNKLAISALRFAPRALIAGAATPPLIVYLLFFFSQTGYYLSAFAQILPGGNAYAQYAREGFFELCTVACINLVIVTIITLLCQRGDKKPALLRVFNSLYALCTLLLIAIAFSKMLLYIDQYGLTRRRLMTAWFMLLLGAFMLFLLVKQLWDKFRLAQVSAVVGVVLCAMLLFVNTDVLIARYNVSAYTSGAITEMDMEQYEDMDTLAVAELVPLTKQQKPDAADRPVAQNAENLINRTVSKLKAKKAIEYTLSDLQAKIALQQAGYWK